MKLHTEIIDPTTGNCWDTTVAQQPARSPFYLSGWAAVLRDSYGYRPAYMVMRSSNGLSAAVPAAEVAPFPMRRKGVSLPFSDCCEPIVSEGVGFGDVFAGILQTAHVRGWQTFEFRGAAQHLYDAPPSSVFTGHCITLYGDEARMEKGLSEATRRNLRRAHNQEITVTFDNSLNATRQFYRLHCVTRKRHGSPPQPFGFFKNIQTRLLESNHGTIALASCHGKTVAASVYLWDGRSVLYKYGASSPHYHDLRANHLIMWEAMRRFAGEGRTELFLGRTDIENKGLLRYKSGWGAREYPIHYFRYDMRTHSFVNSSVSSHSHEQFARRLPVSVLRLVGWCLYRYQG